MLGTSTAIVVHNPFELPAPRKVRTGKDCARCGGKFFSADYKHCGTCRALTNDWTVAWRRTNRLKGGCWWCLRRAAKGHTICEPHLKYVNDHYAEKRAQGLCAAWACKEPSETYLCELHKIPAGRRKAFLRRLARRHAA